LKGGHDLTWRPYGKYVKQTSSQEPLDGLEPYLAEMFLTAFMDPGSHVGFQISTKKTILVEDHPVNISGKFG
jgi:hypothetical protein